ncbi:MAG: hypothetical protein WDO12_05615 [Pseudomonadota bacterium]
MKKRAVCLLLLAAVAPTFAAETAPPPGFAACAAMQDAAQRLACFDQQMAPRAAPAKPAAPAAQPAPAASTAPSLGDDDLRKKPGAAEAAPDVHATITRLTNAGSTSFMVYLDNGQIWRHDDTYLGPFLRVGEAITITSGTLGSYRMTRDKSNSHNWIRVSRVR